MDDFTKFLTKITSLARPLDIEYATNRAILILSFLATFLGFAWRLYAGDGLIANVSWGVGVGIAVFLAWALAREIDPENEFSAFPGILICIIGVLIWGLPSLLGAAWLLGIARMLNRTTGLPAKVLDSLGMTLLTGYLVWQLNWLYGLIAVFAFLFDSFLPDRHPRQIIFAFLAIGATVMGLIFRGELSPVGHLSLISFLSISAISLFFIPVVIRTRRVQVACDFTQDPVYPSRVQAAQVTTLAACWLLAIWQGDSGIIALLPMWAAYLGTSLYGLGAQFFKR